MELNRMTGTIIAAILAMILIVTVAVPILSGVTAELDITRNNDNVISMYSLQQSDFGIENGEHLVLRVSADKSTLACEYYNATPELVKTETVPMPKILLYMSNTGDAVVDMGDSLGIVGTDVNDTEPKLVCGLDQVTMTYTNDGRHSTIEVVYRENGTHFIDGPSLNADIPIYVPTTSGGDYGTFVAESPIGLSRAIDGTFYNDAYVVCCTSSGTVGTYMTGSIQISDGQGGIQEASVVTKYAWTYQLDGSTEHALTRVADSSVTATVESEVMNEYYTWISGSTWSVNGTDLTSETYILAPLSYLTSEAPYKTTLTSLIGIVPLLLIFVVMVPIIGMVNVKRAEKREEEDMER